MKKLLSLVLALVMVLGLAVPAFALETYAEEVIFTLNNYVNDSTPVTVGSVSVKPDTLPNPVTEFKWFYCISGGSSYVNIYDPETSAFIGWKKAAYVENSYEQSEGTPDLNNCAMFAVISIEIGNDNDNKDVFHGEKGCVLKCGNRVIPSINSYIKEENYTNEGEYESACHSFLYIPTDEYWTWQENEITTFVKLFDTTSGSNTKSGSTTITANVERPEVEYEIVIPQAVTMNEAGVKEIGAATINTEAGKLKNATEKTVISYTASGTNFKLSTDDSKTMAATYYSAYTDKDTNTVLDSTKAIDVYKNSALVDPLTKLYVGVSQTDWDTAARTNPGTYTATVTFNFKAEEKEAVVTIADILPEDFPESSYTFLWVGGMACELYATGDNLCAHGGSTVSVPVATVLTPTSGDYDYTCTVDGITWSFAVDNNVFELVEISGCTNEYEELNGIYGIPV